MPVAVWGVTHGLDVVPVRVEHEGTVVARVVPGAQAGWTVVRSARSDRFPVEGVDRLSVVAPECEVNGGADRTALFAAGAGLVLITFLFFGSPGRKRQTPPTPG